MLRPIRNQWDVILFSPVEAGKRNFNEETIKGTLSCTNPIWVAVSTMAKAAIYAFRLLRGCLSVLSDAVERVRLPRFELGVDETVEHSEASQRRLSRKLAIRSLASACLSRRLSEESIIGPRLAAQGCGAKWILTVSVNQTSSPSVAEEKNGLRTPEQAAPAVVIISSMPDEKI